MHGGKLIVFEGIDGVGKATQVKLLEKRLRADRCAVSIFSSPRYDTPVGAVIREALHGKYGNFRTLSPYLSSLPYLVDFALGRSDIAEALKKGTVISDRYIPSSLAYHGAKLRSAAREKFIRFFEDTVYRGFSLPKPDIVLYLDVPIAMAQKQLKGRGAKQKLDQHERDVRYQADVAALYKQLTKRAGWHVVPCRPGDSPEVIHERIWKIIRGKTA